MLDWTFGSSIDCLSAGCWMRMMQNNGAFNVLSAPNSIPSWNLGLQPSTSHSDSGGSAGMLPSATSSTLRQPGRDGELLGFREEGKHFMFALWICCAYIIFCNAQCRNCCTIAKFTNVMLCNFTAVYLCISCKYFRLKWPCTQQLHTFNCVLVVMNIYMQYIHTLEEAIV